MCLINNYCNMCIYSETKTVYLVHWEQNLYDTDIWECYGYSEFYSNGIEEVPRYAEIRRCKLVVDEDEVRNISDNLRDSVDDR